MITVKRISAACLSVILFASSLVFTGCGSRQKTEKISADDTWYSAAKVRVGDRLYKDKENAGIDSSFLGLAGDRVVFLVQGHKKPPEGENEFTYDFTESMFYFIEAYDGDGSLFRSVDINQTLEDSDIFQPVNGDPVNWYLLSDILIKNNNVSVLTQAYIPTGVGDHYDAKSVEFFIDLESGEIDHYEANPNTEWGYKDSFFEFDGYNVLTYSDPYLMMSDAYYIEVSSPDGKMVKYNTEELLPGSAINFIDEMLYLGNARALVFAYSSNSGGLKLYEMDLKTGDIKESLKTADDLMGYFGMVKYFSGIGNVIVDKDGIKRIDIEKNDRECIFSFDDSNLNRSDTDFMQLLAMTEDKIYLTAYPKVSEGCLSSPELFAVNLFILSREKTNPHAGKTVIHATIIDTYSYAVCEAVARFNDTSKDYFIKLDNRYSAQSKIDSGEIDSWDADFSAKIEEAKVEMAYQLKVDLMNGDGPDIVLNGASYLQLNSIDCLIDLNSELSKEGLFENVIDACEYDGRLYQFPLAVSVSGIVAPKSDVGQDQYGFTFDQYKEFVSASCNGSDPVCLFFDQQGYFITCMDKSQDICWNQTSLSYDTPAFRQLAEYVKGIVSQPKISEGEIYELIPQEKDLRENKYEVGLTFPYLLVYYADSLSDVRVLGLPSADSRGPSLKVESSIGISAQTKEKQACLEFARMLLSEDIQETFEDIEDSTPVRISAFEAASTRTVAGFNENYLENKDRFTKSMLMEYGFAWCEIDMSAVSEYENMITSCKSIELYDPALNVIVEEEIPAYFAGQKSLDDVIKIINDRSRLYINERG